jgi:hypothetical protein
MNKNLATIIWTKRSISALYVSQVDQINSPIPGSIWIFYMKLIEWKIIDSKIMKYD